MSLQSDEETVYKDSCCLTVQVPIDLMTNYQFIKKGGKHETAWEDESSEGSLEEKECQEFSEEVEGRKKISDVMLKIRR